jgi:hypothetical protein
VSGSSSWRAAATASTAGAHTDILRGSGRHKKQVDAMKAIRALLVSGWR